MRGGMLGRGARLTGTIGRLSPEEWDFDNVQRLEDESEWMHVEMILSDINLSPGRDEVSWGLE